MTSHPPTLSIGQVAERTGLSMHALRFYEREGLLANDVRRGPNGRRVYSADDVEWLDTCLMLRASGMPLRTIRRYVELVRRGDGNEAERLDVLRQHQEQLTRQIGAMTRCLDLIGYKVRVYEDRLAGAVSDPPDRAPTTAGAAEGG